MNKKITLVVLTTIMLYILESTTCYKLVRDEDNIIVTDKQLPKVVVINKTFLVEPKKVIKKEEIYPQDINLNFDITKKCGYTKEQLTKSISGDNYKLMIPYIDTFLEAEKEYGINALYLMSKLGLESGWCKYRSGINNIAGWTNGKGGYMNFDSVESCIMHVAYKLSTFYKKEVGTKLGNVCALYCPKKGYASKIIRIMKEREKMINS